MIVDVWLISWLQNFFNDAFGPVESKELSGAPSGNRQLPATALCSTPMHVDAAQGSNSNVNSKSIDCDQKLVSDLMIGLTDDLFDEDFDEKVLLNSIVLFCV